MTSKPQLLPHKNREINYGAKNKLAPNEENTPHLDLYGTRQVQGIVGALLYYEREVKNKILVSLSSVGTQQAAATEDTAVAVHQLLYCMSTYPNDGIT